MHMALMHPALPEEYKLVAMDMVVMLLVMMVVMGGSLGGDAA